MLPTYAQPPKIPPGTTMNLNAFMAQAGWLIVIGLTLAIGWADWVTGHELNFFAFYFLPVGLAAWYLGRRAWVTVSLLSTLTWLWADLLAGHHYSLKPIAVWNTAIRLTSFLLIGRSVAIIQRLLISEAETAEALRRALDQVKILEGLLPVCAWCKRIRDDHGQWHSMEDYLSQHTDATFTHGACPDCGRRFLEDAAPPTLPLSDKPPLRQTIPPG